MCNNNGVKDCWELLEVSQQNVWEYIFYDEAIKSQTEIEWEPKHCTIVSEKPRPQAFHW